MTLVLTPLTPSLDRRISSDPLPRPQPHPQSLISGLGGEVPDWKVTMFGTCMLRKEYKTEDKRIQLCPEILEYGMFLHQSTNSFVNRFQCVW